jgi:hypothetical protein
MVRHRWQSPGGTNILQHSSSRKELLFQGNYVFGQLVPQGFQASAEDSIVEKEASHILKYSQSFSKAVEVGIDKA